MGRVLAKCDVHIFHMIIEIRGAIFWGLYVVSSGVTRGRGPRLRRQHEEAQIESSEMFGMGRRFELGQHLLIFLGVRGAVSAVYICRLKYMEKNGRQNEESKTYMLPGSQKPSIDTPLGVSP